MLSSFWYGSISGTQRNDRRMKIFQEEFRSTHSHGRRAKPTSVKLHDSYDSSA